MQLRGLQVQGLGFMERLRDCGPRTCSCSSGKSEFNCVDVIAYELPYEQQSCRCCNSAMCTKTVSNVKRPCFGAVGEPEKSMYPNSQMVHSGSLSSPYISLHKYVLWDQSIYYLGVCEN